MILKKNSNSGVRCWTNSSGGSWSGTVHVPTSRFYRIFRGQSYHWSEAVVNRSKWYGRFEVFGFWSKNWATNI